MIVDTAEVTQNFVRWVKSAFGDESFHSRHERVARVVEEAIELAQAAGLEHVEVAQISSRVYSRETGTVEDETNGLVATLVVLIEHLAGDNFYARLYREYQRVSKLDLEHVRNKHRLKVLAGTSKVSIPKEDS